MLTQVDFDHTSFAVPDALHWARHLRHELGATPIAGETLPEFRYLLLYVGDEGAGTRLELLEPVGEGFLHRFLDRHGVGAHHVTFTVPDLRRAVELARAAGHRVVGEDYDHAPWREAFVMPDAVHGIVIQLAESDSTYPSPSQLLATAERDPSRFPSSRGASEPLWWSSLWEVERGPTAILGATHLTSTDLAASRRLFADVLGGAAVEDGADLRITWPSGSLVITPGGSPGVVGMELSGGPPGGIDIGTTRLHQELGRHGGRDEQGSHPA